MNRLALDTRLVRNVVRAAGGFVAAAGLLMAGSGMHPHAASAIDYDLGAPTLLSVSLDAPDALVSFRDNSNQEIGYNIYASNMSNHDLDRRVQTTGVPGQGRVKTATVDGLQANSRYCFLAAAIGSDGITDSANSNEICADPPASATPSTALDPGPPPSPVTTRAGDASCLVCPNTKVVGMPSSFRGQRISRGSSTVVLLTWDPISAAAFYQLRAVSHQDGKTALDAGDGANDIGAAKAAVTVNGKQLTGFLADGTATSVPGGADYYLSACSAPGQCGNEAMVFVPGP
jgi:hypothetical protein